MNSKVKYHYAYNERRILINIRNVSQEYRDNHKFYCVSCGAEMVAKLGNVNTHHFAHKCGDDSCSSETYLHKLGKMLFKQKFEESATFIIEYQRIIKCKKRSSCFFYVSDKCKELKFEAFDLKKYYNTCVEEQVYGGYRADLLLFDSEKPNREPIFIEIRVTHKCTKEKQNSGAKIIEISVKNDEDIFKFMNLNIYECEEIKFIGFDTISKTELVLTKRSLSRFWLYPDGAAYVNYNSSEPNCNDERLKPRHVLELNIVIGYLGDFSAYDYGLVTAMEKGYDIKNCNLCRYKRLDYQRNVICCVYKKLGTPQYPEQTEACKCKFYYPNKMRIKKIKEDLVNCTIEEVE